MQKNNIVPFGLNSTILVWDGGALYETSMGWYTEAYDSLMESEVDGYLASDYLEVEVSSPVVPSALLMTYTN